MMRDRRLIVVLSALLVSAAGVARADVVSPQAPGWLAVSDGAGTVSIRGDGVIYGLVGQGSLVLMNYKPGVAGGAPAVTGATAHVSDGLVVYSGLDIRFLLPEGRYDIEVIGSGIDLSAVGHGTASVVPPTAGAPAASSSGQMVLNGASPVSVDTLTTSGSFGPHTLP
jgi:hypothetical protein